MADHRIADRRRPLQDVSDVSSRLSTASRMTERDAFGRLIAGQGPTVQPTGSPNPGPTGRPPRRDGSGLRRFLWWFVIVDLIVIVTVAVVLLSGGDDDDVVIIPPSPGSTQVADASPGEDADNDDRPTKPTPVTPATPATPATPTVQPAGFNATSLLRPDNFERALNSARSLSRGRPLMVRAEAMRVDLQLARPDGTLVIMQVPATGTPRVITQVAGAAKGRSTMAWSAIDPRAPQRLARSTKSTPSSGPRSTNYVVFLEQTRRWVLYRTSGSGFTGDASGRGGAKIPGT